MVSCLAPLGSLAQQKKINIDSMTANNRIILNFIATYGRSVYALVLGLFSARWILGALGKSDFGLFGVVGSIIIVIGFLNGVLGGAVSRYYAYAIGEAKHMNRVEARQHMLRWFNAAVSIHTVVPLFLCLVGFPMGMYAIDHWLVIPDGRMVASKWVFALSLCCAFVNMVSVPYISMYRARQLIAELSVWGLLQTTLVFVGAYLLRYVSSDRLIAYAVLMTFVPAGILIIQDLRARRQFDDCHVDVRFLFNMEYIWKLLSYSFWEIFASGGDVVRAQGTAFLINRNFGTDVNASWTVSAQVSGQTTALSSAMIGSLTPALTTSAGAGEEVRMRKLTFAICRFGSFFILIFAIPLIIDMDYVLRLWLVSPPPHTVTLCRCMLVALVCHKLGIGHHMAILAYGHVAPLLMTTGFISALTILVVWAFIRIGYGAIGIGLSFVISYSALTLARILFAKCQLRLSLLDWLRDVLCPIVVVSVASTGVGVMVFRVLHESFLRTVAISISTLIVSIGLGWFLICKVYERKHIKSLVVGLGTKYLNNCQS